MIQIPDTVKELAGAMTPTWLFIFVGLAIILIARHILILAVAFRHNKSKRLGILYFIVLITDILTVGFLIALWQFRDLIVKISFI